MSKPKDLRPKMDEMFDILEVGLFFLISSTSLDPPLNTIISIEVTDNLPTHNATFGLRFQVEKP
jgi:hypothetical protein